MNDIVKILSKYSDQELAFLHTYNLDKYMKNTQALICDYIFEDRKFEYP